MKDNIMLKKIKDYQDIRVYNSEVAEYEAGGGKLSPERAEKVARYLAGQKAYKELCDSCIEFDSPEKEKFREMLSTGEYSILVSWYSPVRPGENVHFSCYPGKVFLASKAYDHGPFSSLEEAEDFIFRVEKADLDSCYEDGGEVPFWHYAPSGKECSPPDFTKYGYRTVEGPSDYWWIEPF